MNIQFIVNLRTDTTKDDFDLALKPHGWLAAPKNVTKTLRLNLPHLIKHHWLFADNGNFALIGKVAATLEAEARPISDIVSKIEHDLGHTPNRSEISKLLKQQVAKLAKIAEVQSVQSQSNGGDPLKAQLNLNPTHLIGLEDITLAVFLRLGLDLEWLPYKKSDYKHRNETVAKNANDVRQRPDSEFATSYFPVASALDYNTAFDAGQVFALAGHDRVAMGFGAYMADNSYSDGYRVGNRWIRLKQQLPNRYLRTALVARGFFDGYRDAVEKLPFAFHFLGLGAPIMLAVVARAALGIDQITFDATSPIKDAVEATLYVNRPAYLKIRTWKVAQRLAESPIKRWNCPCPFCRDFVETHPFDYDAIKNAVNLLGRPVEANDLRTNGSLYIAAPLLSQPNGGQLGQEVTFARMGHNHWVLNGICRQLRQASKNEITLEQKLDNIIKEYSANSKGDIFAQAIQRAAEISRGNIAGD